MKVRVDCFQNTPICFLCVGRCVGRPRLLEAAARPAANLPGPPQDCNTAMYGADTITILSIDVTTIPPFVCVLIVITTREASEFSARREENPDGRVWRKSIAMDVLTFTTRAFILLVDETTQNKERCTLSCMYSIKRVHLSVGARTICTLPLFASLCLLTPAPA